MRIAKEILLILIFANLLFSNQYGPAILELEKTWTINGEPGTEIELDGIFIINNTYQKVTAIEIHDGAKLKYEKNGIIKIAYSGNLSNETEKITAKATVYVFYQFALPADASWKIGKIDATEYTNYTEEMAKKANELSDEESFYGTIRNMTDWTNKYIKYDLNYFGKNVPAKKVFKDRHGVCVEYSHLLLSLLRAVGVNGTYVSGYVYSREWQPHAWLEIDLPNGHKLAIDPTFGEAQNLDNSHIATYYSEDQEGVFDKILSDKKVEFESSEKITVLSMENSIKRPAEVEYYFNESSEQIIITLKNNLNEYVLFPYSMSIPEEAGEGERTLILLAPKETKKLTYRINPGYIKEGFIYTIPIMVQVNDFENKYEIVLSKEPQKKEETKICGIMFVLAGGLIFAIRRD